MEFKDRFNELLGEERGAGQRLSKAIGASSGVINGWKTGEKSPPSITSSCLQNISLSRQIIFCVSQKRAKKRPPSNYPRMSARCWNCFRKSRTRISSGLSGGSSRWFRRCLRLACLTAWERNRLPRYRRGQVLKREGRVIWVYFGYGEWR